MTSGVENTPDSGSNSTKNYLIRNITNGLSAKPLECLNLITNKKFSRARKNPDSLVFFVWSYYLEMKANPSQKWHTGIREWKDRRNHPSPPHSIPCRNPRVARPTNGTLGFRALPHLWDVLKNGDIHCNTPLFFSDVPLWFHPRLSCDAIPDLFLPKNARIAALLRHAPHIPAFLISSRVMDECEMDCVLIIDWHTLGPSVCWSPPYPPR